MNHPGTAEQWLEARLSVFAGSFSPEAAKAILAQDEAGGDLADLINDLVRREVLEEQPGATQRYRLSEERRREARARLCAGGAEDRIYSQLVDYYLGLAGQSLEAAFGPERARWMNLLEQEHVNLQSIFEWLLERGDAERGLRLAYLLQELWFEDQHTSEGRALFAALLALPSASTRTSARARYLDLAGAFALSQNDYLEARALKQEGIAVCRELADKPALGSSLIHLGHVELYAGDFPAAQKLYEEARQIFIDLSDPVWIARATGNLSHVALELGDYERANKWVRESLQRYRELDLEWEWAGEIGIAAGVAAGLGRAEQAIRLAGASAAQRERIGVSLPPQFKERYEQIIASARQALSDSVHKRLWEEGQAMTLEEATECALGKRLGPPCNIRSVQA